MNDDSLQSCECQKLTASFWQYKQKKKLRCRINIYTFNRISVTTTPSPSSPLFSHYFLCPNVNIIPVREKKKEKKSFLLRRRRKKKTKLSVRRGGVKEIHFHRNQKELKLPLEETTTNRETKKKTQKKIFV